MLKNLSDNSPEGQWLADRINKFVVDADVNPDQKIYKQGLEDFNSIKLNLKFITKDGLNFCLKNLNDNGNAVYERYFKKYFDFELSKK